MWPSIDTYRNTRLTQDNNGVRPVKRSPRPTRRTIVILLSEIAELELANWQNAPKRMWKIIGEIQGKSPSEPTSKVKALSRLVISSKQDLMEEWRKYFVNLINAPPVSSTADIPPAEVDLLIKTGAYTRTEVEVTIQSLKNSNAPSIDSFMCTEAIKYGGERLLNKLVTLLNLVKNNLVIPNEWKTFICVPLQRKVSQLRCQNTAA